jgi:replicative DNA helicase
MRGTPCDAVPWSENQIATAQKETREEVEVILNEAKELFYDISNSTSSTNILEITKEVFQFIDQIKERTK